jgi:hypothetical protein
MSYIINFNDDSNVFKDFLRRPGSEEEC